MGFFQNLFGKSASPAAERTPFQVLGLAIIHAANQCTKRMKPLFPSAKAKSDTAEIEMYVFFEFLFFFMHMTNRSAHSQGFTSEQIEKLQQSVYPDVIAVAIDSFMLHWPEEYKVKIRDEFYDNVNSADVEYSTSKRLMSEGYKPLSGDSLLDKLSRNVAAKMDKPYNPEVLIQALTAALEELRNANLLKLVADTRPAVCN
jgi:hypothetical protein